MTRPVRHVTFYSKPGCHLCEDAEELLDALRDDYDLRVTWIDITGDLEIYERYKYEIPVVIVEDGGTASGRIDEAALRRALRTATAS
ncbi:MAG TPA: glutaredoxin family protein [Chloroflexota bacterium]|nr:glutaredoxin family protein [Chloroflexota bacterium]